MTNNLQRLLIKIYDGWLLCANQDVLKHLWALSYWPGTIAYFVKKWLSWNSIGFGFESKA